MTYPVISARELMEYQRRSCDLLLLDIRSEEEYQAGHIDGAVNMPYESLRAKWTALPEGKVIVTYCDRGSLSLLACRELRDRGKHAFSLAGGLRCYRMLTGKRWRY